MSELLLQYEKVNPTTWVYLSSLLIIGLYFKFNRFWSVRNLDIILLISFAPGLVLVHLGQQEQLIALSMQKELEEVKQEESALPGNETTTSPASSSLPAAAEASDPSSSSETGSLIIPGTDDNASLEGSGKTASRRDQQQVIRDHTDHAEDLQRLGFVWLMVVGGLFLVRLLLDPALVRRPLLEPNLSLGGLTFLGLSLFVFLIANVMIAGYSSENAESEARTVALSKDRQLTDQPVGLQQGPGYSLLENVPSVPIMPWRADDIPQLNPVDYRLSRLLVILSHLAIVLGMVAIGYWHFENFKMGIGVATLYLILPYTAQMAGRVDHAFPAAMLVWAIVFYRRPLISGAILGFSACIYYPLFLLPLWLSYYSQRGLVRFISGVITSLALLVLLLYLNTPTEYFVADLRRMFGLMMPRMDDLQGIWMLGWDPAFRLPVMTAFFALSATFALWPAQKNLGTLMSCSAAVLVATRFWNGNGGGLYMGWYLPLILVTVFRPNLEDRVARTVLIPGWLGNRDTLPNTD